MGRGGRGGGGGSFRPAFRAPIRLLIDLRVSPRFPRGARTGLLPFHPGIDDQTRFPTGRRNARRRQLAYGGQEGKEGKRSGL